MSIRHVVTAALVVSGALALTACGPTDEGGKNDEKGSASAAPSQQPADGKDKGKSKDKSDYKDPCAPLPKGHKLIKVNSVEGAMNNIIAQDAKVSCNTKMDEGAFYRPEGPTYTYAFDNENAKVTVLSLDGPQVRPTKPTDKTLSGIGHVKECADPNHQQYDNQSKADHKEWCAGQNYYNVTLGPDKKIIEMVELSGS
ncbi:hypothetical protein [Streptomyces abikoensis]|uniref:hypothetical protein n=1 Tax=Streptomyces abikoensis TaxID=97398 RepID=UPI00167C0981|nr:hypothetical protein [Streptomyces abikoensis]GGP59139.1 hypothetical protein GCM10010214_36110 [Streptomyces abikoensis]